jgi:hypothetical protein
VFTHAGNPRIVLQPEAFGLSWPSYRLHALAAVHVTYGAT